MPEFEEVILLSMEGCPFCEEARADLKTRGIEFREVELQPGTELFSYLAGILGDVRVPIIITVGFNGSCSFGPGAYCTIPQRK